MKNKWFKIIKEKKDLGIIFTCEHASPKIPVELKNLGLKKNELLKSKDINDPFAFDLFKLFIKKYKSFGIYTTYSRLVIDMNRRLDAVNKNSNSYHSALIKTKILTEDSSGREYFLDIPDNKKISYSKEEQMYKKICLPYQKVISDKVLELKKKNKKVLVISVHTMFPKYNGPLRPIEIDLIGEEKSDVFKSVAHILKKSKYKIGLNKPWGFKDVDGGALKKVSEVQGVEVFAFEIRNDLLDSPKKMNEVFKVLDYALETTLKNIL